MEKMDDASLLGILQFKNLLPVLSKGAQLKNILFTKK